MSANTDISGLINFCREQREQLENPKTEGEKLRNRIMFENFRSNQELIDLQNEVQAFFQSDASDEDKKIVGDCTEVLGMMCSAIKDGVYSIGG